MKIVTSGRSSPMFVALNAGLKARSTVPGGIQAFLHDAIDQLFRHA